MKFKIILPCDIAWVSRVEHRLTIHQPTLYFDADWPEVPEGGDAIHLGRYPFRVQYRFFAMDGSIEVVLLDFWHADMGPLPPGWYQLKPDGTKVFVDEKTGLPQGGSAPMLCDEDVAALGEGRLLPDEERDAVCRLTEDQKIALADLFPDAYRRLFGARA